MYVTYSLRPLVVSAIPTATPTRTPVPVGDGPLVTYLGVAGADGVPLTSTARDDQGRPIFVVESAVGTALVVEGRPGVHGRPVGRCAYGCDSAWPDLQVLVDRPLGDGSAAVCDIGPPAAGGVPATVDLSFAPTDAVRDALYDLGCRANDGTGAAQGQVDRSLACTRRDGMADFVDPTSALQFCVPIAMRWTFPPGDTTVAARVQNTDRATGTVREIVVHVAPARG